jgi:hypothetical protein
MEWGGPDEPSHGGERRTDRPALKTNPYSDFFFFFFPFRFGTGVGCTSP